MSPPSPGEAPLHPAGLELEGDGPGGRQVAGEPGVVEGLEGGEAQAGRLHQQVLDQVPALGGGARQLAHTQVKPAGPTTLDILETFNFVSGLMFLSTYLHSSTLEKVFTLVDA